MGKKKYKKFAAIFENMNERMELRRWNDEEWEWEKIEKTDGDLQFEFSILIDGNQCHACD